MEDGNLKLDRRIETLSGQRENLSQSVSHQTRREPLTGSNSISNAKTLSMIPMVTPLTSRSITTTSLKDVTVDIKKQRRFSAIMRMPGMFGAPGGEGASDAAGGGGDSGPPLTAGAANNFGQGTPVPSAAEPAMPYRNRHGSIIDLSPPPVEPTETGLEM